MLWGGSRLSRDTGRWPLPDLGFWEVTLDDDGSGEVTGSENLFREFDGYLCWMAAVRSSRLRLVERDVVPPPPVAVLTEPLRNQGFQHFWSSRGMAWCWFAYL
jgi:hypothetical protein